jgi:hypothetical protein
VVPSGGNIQDHASKTCISLKSGQGGNYIAKLCNYLYLPVAREKFGIPSGSIMKATE